jgi:phosphinothricin acetyltransferase
MTRRREPMVAEIRDATLDDVPTITAIQSVGLTTTTHEWTERPYVETERAEWLDRQRACGNPVLVASLGGEILGWACYGPFRDTARWPGYRHTVEHTIHVREDHWGKGIGQTLLDALVMRARAVDIHVMVAAIDSSNARSIAFHERLGFVECGRMPETGRKFGRWLDLVLMQRIVGDGT